MLKTFFDFKVATFHRLSDVVLEEVLQADVVEIGEYVKGGIYHSRLMRWIGSLSGVSEPKQLIRSKKERKVLQENKKWFEQQGYSFSIVEMSPKLFNEFRSLYEETTLKTERPLKFSLKDQVLGKILVGSNVYLIGMYKENVLESGLVFSISEEHEASVSFGAKKKFDERRGGVGGVLEMMLIEFCLGKSVKRIVHGRTRNPIGITSKAGVFEFKSRYGFSAYPEGYWLTTFILNPKIVLSDLIFVSILQYQVGYIVVSNNNPDETMKKYKTRDINLVKAISQKQLIAASRKFVRQLEKKTSNS